MQRLHVHPWRLEALCALPFDINAIHRVALRDPVRFEPCWSERAHLERRPAALVPRGVKAGHFRRPEPHLAALTILSNDKGVQNWCRPTRSRRPRTIGETLATLIVGGLLAPGGSLASFEDEIAEADFMSASAVSH